MWLSGTVLALYVIDPRFEPNHCKPQWNNPGLLLQCRSNHAIHHTHKHTHAHSTIIIIITSTTNSIPAHNPSYISQRMEETLQILMLVWKALHDLAFVCLSSFILYHFLPCTSASTLLSALLSLAGVFLLSASGPWHRRLFSLGSSTLCLANSLFCVAWLKSHLLREPFSESLKHLLVGCFHSTLVSWSHTYQRLSIYLCDSGFAIWHLHWTVSSWGHSSFVSFTHPRHTA